MTAALIVSGRFGDVVVASVLTPIKRCSIDICLGLILRERYPCQCCYFGGYAIRMKLPFPYVETSLKIGRKNPRKAKAFQGFEMVSGTGFEPVTQ